MNGMKTRVIAVAIVVVAPQAQNVEMVLVKMERILAIVVKIVVLVEMVNVRPGMVRIVALALKIVVLVLRYVEMASVKMERIQAIVFKIVLLVEMVLVKVGMEKIVVVAPKIVVLVGLITRVIMEIF